MKRAYLDWASAAPVHPRALVAFKKAAPVFGNPSSPHEEGLQAKALLDEARSKIARLAGVKSRAVVFTSGATEANALAIQGRIEHCRASGMEYVQMHVLYLPTMHSSVIKTLDVFGSKGVQLEKIPLQDFSINEDALRARIRPETILITCDAICGETGTRFNTLRIRRMIDALKQSHTTLLHVDSSQLPLVESIDYTRLGADMMSLDAQKVGGIRGIGALIIPDAKGVVPIVQGGGQENGLRPGTEPVALATAFAEALTVRNEGLEKFTKKAVGARKKLLASLEASIPTLIRNEGKNHAPHIINISCPLLDTDYAVALLNARGIAISTRSACETDSEDGSKTVFALTKDEDRSKSTLRISWGPETSEKDLARLAKVLPEITTFLADH